MKSLNVKLQILNILLFILILMGTMLPLTASAHELVPKALIEYIKEHPGATPEEIREFAETQNPEFLEKFKSGEEILMAARDRDTSLLDTLYDFCKIGLTHILGGLDHILFVLSLLLIFVSWKEVLKLTAAFTIAHSVTLILAGTGVLVLSSQIVEPIIALSIVYVAVSSVFLSNNKWFGTGKAKLATVFFFGLFHGLGFAGLLQEIDIPRETFLSSLFAFNFGIEVGQLLIVAIAFPFIYYFRNKAWYPAFIKISAGVISLVALFWFIQRILFP